LHVVFSHGLPFFGLLSEALSISDGFFLAPVSLDPEPQFLTLSGAAHFLASTCAALSHAAPPQHVDAIQVAHFLSCVQTFFSGDLYSMVSPSAFSSLPRRNAAPMIARTPDPDWNPRLPAGASHDFSPECLPHQTLLELLRLHQLVHPHVWAPAANSFAHLDFPSSLTPSQLAGGPPSPGTLLFPLPSDTFATFWRRFSFLMPDALFAAVSDAFETLPLPIATEPTVHKLRSISAHLASKEVPACFIQGLTAASLPPIPSPIPVAASRAALSALKVPLLGLLPPSMLHSASFDQHYAISGAHCAVSARQAFSRAVFPEPRVTAAAHLLVAAPVGLTADLTVQALVPTLGFSFFRRLLLLQELIAGTPSPPTGRPAYFPQLPAIISIFARVAFYRFQLLTAPEFRALAFCALSLLLSEGDPASRAQLAPTVCRALVSFLSPAQLEHAVNLILSGVTPEPRVALQLELQAFASCALNCPTVPGLVASRDRLVAISRAAPIMPEPLIGITRALGRDCSVIAGLLPPARQVFADADSDNSTANTLLAYCSLLTATLRAQFQISVSCSRQILGNPVSPVLHAAAIPLIITAACLCQCSRAKLLANCADLTILAQRFVRTEPLVLSPSVAVWRSVALASIALAHPSLPSPLVDLVEPRFRPPVVSVQLLVAAAQRAQSCGNLALVGVINTLLFRAVAESQRLPLRSLLPTFDLTAALAFEATGICRPANANPPKFKHGTCAESFHFPTPRSDATPATVNASSDTTASLVVHDLRTAGHVLLASTACLSSICGAVDASAVDSGEHSHGQASGSTSVTVSSQAAHDDGSTIALTDAANNVSVALSKLRVSLRCASYALQLANTHQPPETFNLCETASAELAVFERLLRAAPVSLAFTVSGSPLVTCAQQAFAALILALTEVITGSFLPSPPRSASLTVSIHTFAVASRVTCRFTLRNARCLPNCRVWRLRYEATRRELVMRDVTAIVVDVSPNSYITVPVDRHATHTPQLGSGPHFYSPAPREGRLLDMEDSDTTSSECASIYVCSSCTTCEAPPTVPDDAAIALVISALSRLSGTLHLHLDPKCIGKPSAILLPATQIGSFCSITAEFPAHISETE
jgi:hypothetical protein